MKAHEISGREFLDSMTEKGEAMMATYGRGPPNEWMERRSLDLNSARRGEFVPPDLCRHDGMDSLSLETLSSAEATRHVVYRLARHVEEQGRMIRFLVERVPGPVRTGHEELVKDEKVTT